MALSALQIQEIVDATKTPTPEQMRVIEAPRRPLLVVAGAGSGKTETMSMRVLWLLANHPDLSPSSILGLTFTRKAAGELGERLRERIRLLSREMPRLRERLDEDPVSLTYNSFAERIVSEHGMRIGIDPDFSMLSEAGALDLMLQIVEAWPTDLDEDLTPLGAVGQILHLAGEIAEHGYTVESAREALEEFGRELEQVGQTNDDARRLLRANRRRIAFLDPIAAYQQRKRDMGVLDFSDQLVLATRIVREAPAVRESLREEFRAVLLDEFQDTSVIQMDMLSMLFGDHAVTAVGDPNQAIYGWRGASASSLESFLDRFQTGEAQESQTLTLSTAWRNDQAILDAANRVAAPLREVAAYQEGKHTSRRSRPSWSRETGPDPVASTLRTPPTTRLRWEPSSTSSAACARRRARAAGGARSQCCAGDARILRTWTRPCAMQESRRKSWDSGACSISPPCRTCAPRWSSPTTSRRPRGWRACWRVSTWVPPT